MQRFARLYLTLDETAGPLEKVEALSLYFGEAPPRDAAWALYFLLGQRLPRALGTGELRELVTEASGLPPWLIEVSIEQAGDLAEAVALLAHENAGDAEPDQLPLHEVVEHYLLPLKDAPDARRREVILGLWARLDPGARLVYNRFLMGELRAAAPRGLVIRALAEVAGVTPAEMAHRLTGHWQPTAEDWEHLIAGDHSLTSPGQPYPFFLAWPLEGPPGALGTCAAFQAEWHFDGVRIQLLRRRGALMLWSRAEEFLNERFPELSAAAAALPEGTVLDGSIVAWNGAAPLPLECLQPRLTRKRADKKLLASAPAVFMAYDLLEGEGRDLRGEPLHVRRGMLEQLFETLDPEGPLRLSPILDAAGWLELERHHASARAVSARGLILKRLDSPYRIGRIHGDWWKWSAPAHTVDTVLLYAESASARGRSGQGSGLHGQFTLGVWSDGLLVPIAKAAADLPEDELREIEAFIYSNTVEKFGPVRVVRQELVFELAFEAAVRSPRHKAGLVLRNSRVTRWRRAALPGDAGAIEALRALMR